MKKALLIGSLVLALAFASALPATAQSQAAGNDLEEAVVKALLSLPHYSVFDNLFFEADGKDVTLMGQVVLEITKAEGPAFEGRHSFEGPSNFDPLKAERISGVVRADGSVHFVDNDGTYSAIPNGEGTYEVTYQESGAEDQTFVIGTLSRA